jgi:glycine oxidase
VEKRVAVVGAGLAGLCMAYRLHELDIPFVLFHADRLPCSSEKAAGLMNPVVVKRLLPTWLAAECMACNREFYPYVERLTGHRFFSALSVHRFFPNVLSVQEWKAKIAEGGMTDYLSDTPYAYRPDLYNSAEWGGGDIYGAASVDCTTFIRESRTFFTQKNSLLIYTLSYGDILPEAGSVTICGEVFSHVVFCEGMGAVKNPWFGSLPLIPTKGQLMWLDIPELPREKEVMKGIFLAPRMQGGFVCGSTYEWQFDSEEPTPSGMEKLRNDLEKMIRVPYKVNNHTAGVRPASRDRRPFMGNHPVYPSLFVFNGLGTKGYMLAPYLSLRLTEYMLHGKQLPAEADIRRLKK